MQEYSENATYFINDAINIKQRKLIRIESAVKF